ncbi:hypothetical protein CkaCkLH20_12082 [Colletotrichum karsti]|uniref:Cell wall glucanase n=1 Tax=Colletotrichum karsti TaxID=1095194 RepID=A0A9P6I1X8_9PEZI|nr:uncharacterized protein CkaCkLH20_12082 [Colletotrichum karsti]KAF9870415.1 hypothetical protein CkaCkLH20_12082 [Colletotrichum karsti]
MAGQKYNHKEVKAAARRRVEDPAKRTTSNSTSSPVLRVSDDVSDSDSDSVQSLGDFDPVGDGLDINGGADLSDITTPPTSPLIHAPTPFAADRLFERNTAGRARGLSEKSLALRVVDDFGVHDAGLKRTHPELLRHGLHIFIDASNQILGFYDALKQLLGVHKHKPLPPCISMSAVHEVLARKRTVVKSYIAGSKNPTHKRRSRYFDDAEALGYRPLVKNRVTLPKDAKSQRRHYYDDDSDDMAGSYQAEEGVDEMIQTQMHYSVMDDNPGVMVLVTGDGNQNETGFSDGFPADVKRALKRGWAVEIYAFKNTCAGIWTSPEFVDNDQWAGRYSVNYLDAYTQAFCNPVYRPQLESLAAEHASRPGLRSVQSSFKRKTHWTVSLGKEAVNESTLIVKSEKFSAAQASPLQGKWRIPSPQKKVKSFGSVLSYRPAPLDQFTSSRSSSTVGHEQQLQISTSNALDEVDSIATSSITAFRCAASLRPASGLANDASGSFHKSISPLGIKI